MTDKPNKPAPSTTASNIDAVRSAWRNARARMRALWSSAKENNAPVVAFVTANLGPGPLLFWSIGIALLCLFLGFFVDPWLTPWIKAHMSEAHSVVWRTITDFGRAEKYIVGCLIAFAVLALLSTRSEEKADRYRAGARNSLYVLATLAASGIAINLMKFILGRQRPKALFENDFYGMIPFNLDHAMSSFPSGHSQTIWAVVTPLMILFPRFSPICIFLGLLIAFSRVALTVHFLSDAIAGAFVAIVAAILLKRYYLDQARQDTVTGFETPPWISDRAQAWAVDIRAHRPIVEDTASAEAPSKRTSKKVKKIAIRRKSKSQAKAKPKPKPKPKAKPKAKPKPKAKE
jgi:membrane-associated phospholipid phosphatase